VAHAFSLARAAAVTIGSRFGPIVLAAWEDRVRWGIGVAALAGVVAASAPGEIGWPSPGLGEALAAERPARASVPSKARSAKSTAARREPARDGRPGFGKPVPYAPSFAAPLYGRPYARGPFVPNPLVSSDHRATPEYDYLYTAALASASPPAPSSYRYAADSSYLLRPTFGRSGIALAYRWRYCMNTGLAQGPRAPAAARLGAQDAPAAGRDRGRKIDNALDPSAILAGHPRALAGAGGAKLQLAEALQPSWTSAETHRPCVTVR
jgi:hypothetical protein